MKLENIIVLEYANNECYTNVITIEETLKKRDNFSIDLKTKTWMYEGKIHKIGDSRYIDSHSHYGVIGVYDKTSIEHLNYMVSNAKSATESDHYCFND